jgi:pimeloyl-ACP methyl ester carboxylesterase
MLRHRIRRRGLIAVPLAAALLGTALAGPARAGQASPGRPGASCQEYRVPVSVADGLVGSYHIAGILCRPAGTASPTVQLLVPGATYDHIYWDFPMAGYSYARYAADHGQASFAIDRFNTGDSSMLPSALVTVQLDANVLHQVVGALRAGRVGGARFTKVVLAGHSLGSIIVADEAATYHDVDGVILTGFTNYPSVEFAAGLATAQVVIPAQLASPKFARQPLGDLSTPPGGRARWFYDTSDANPAVIAEDDATESVITAGEMASLAPPLVLPETNLINVPVLLAQGQNDIIFACVLTTCHNAALLRSTEGPRFTAAPSLDTFVLPGAGHDINLSRNRTQFFHVATAWVTSHVAG